jgi:hypothetical protein
MNTDNVIQSKSYAFAVRVVRLSSIYLAEEACSFQVLRCGTSIGGLLRKPSA